MSTSTEPSKRISANWIYLGIIILLIATGLYFMLTKNISEEENVDLTNQVEQISTDKNNLEQEYNAALVRLDELKTKGSQMENIIAQKNSEVENLKKQINGILAKQNASNNELMLANKLIAELNAKLNNFATQNQQYATANEQLKVENNTVVEQKNKYDEDLQNLNAEKIALEQKIEKGSVLSASNFKILAYNKKKKFLVVGKKVNKETEKAKKADAIKVSFEIDANRITASGNKIINICIYTPDGNIAFVKGDINQVFKLADGSEKKYSTLENIPYKAGERIQNISVEWEPATDIKKGNYLIEVYNMGYKIGNSLLVLQ